MADFTKLIEQANAAEQLPEKNAASADASQEQDNVESLVDRRAKLTQTEKRKPEPIERQQDPTVEPEFQSNPNEPWTNFTTRLRAATKKRLHQLCLERQLANTPPWGQQELVEEAIVAIINKYLSGSIAT